MTTKIIKEACIGSLETAQAYLETDKIHLIDRIETCSALDQGGLTPDLKLFQYIKAKAIPQVVMIRRNNNFVLQSASELTWLQADLKFYLSHGAKEFIFGFLDDEQKIDVATCKSLIKTIQQYGQGDEKWNFHMAIDAVEDYDQAFQTLIELQFQRVLTKGGLQPAMHNLEQLKILNAKYGQQIQILVGGQVTKDNYQKICQATGIKQAHGRLIA